MTSMDAALRPLATRLGGMVREHEVLRIVATIHGKDTERAANEARLQVLAWAQNRCGGRLPNEAWDCENFEYLAGGRNSVGIRLRSDVADMWAIRADDPDRLVAGRVWTTEVIVGSRPGHRPRLSTRLLVNTPEADLEIDPHTPGLVQQLSERCGLSIGPYDIEPTPWLVEREDDAHRLVDALVDPERQFPWIVLSLPEGAPDRGSAAVDADMLSRAVLGLAQIVVVPAEHTWTLTNRLGRVRSVFGGAARLYLPGFTEAADPFRHRLFLADQLTTENEAKRAVRWLRSIVATESIRRNRLGRDIPAFGDVRNASLRARQDQLAQEGASDSEQLAAAHATIKALESRVEEERAALTYFDEETRAAQERAEAAEAQLRAAAYLIRQLQDRVRSAGEEIDDQVPAPEAWADFAEWCDTHYAGRVALAPAARRNSKDALFEDVALATRCVQWLGTTYREGRLNGSDGGFRDFAVEAGVRNTLCGGDEFELDWQGRRHTADWHIKNGGNTRDPQRCLRIYYFWEPETQQVVIADMPYHRRSAFS